MLPGALHCRWRQLLTLKTQRRQASSTAPEKMPATTGLMNQLATMDTMPAHTLQSQLDMIWLADCLLQLSSNGARQQPAHARPGQPD